MLPFVYAERWEIMTAREHLSKHDRHDREIAEIRAIQKTTNEHLGKLARAMLQLNAALNKLSAEVRELTGHMRRGGSNGHAKRKVDLQ
jgi:hypothetical protein